jgi:hypothetical protein
MGQPGNENAAAAYKGFISCLGVCPLWRCWTDQKENCWLPEHPGPTNRVGALACAHMDESVPSTGELLPGQLISGVLLWGLSDEWPLHGDCAQGPLGGISQNRVLPQVQPASPWG